MITYIVHSTSTDNELGVRSGWSDVSLSETGRQQALELKQSLSGKNFDQIICSDLLRTRQTTEIAFDGRTFTTDARLREMNYGDLNGCPGSRFPSDDNWCIDGRFSNGENCRDVERRLHDLLDDLPDREAEIAIVSHKYPQLAMEVICNALSWTEAIRLDWRKNGQWQAGWQYSI